MTTPTFPRSLTRCVPPLVSAGVLALALTSSSCWAESSTPAPTDSTVTTPAHAPQDATTESGTWSPNPGPGKTRAQVYQELVHAQQDGEMARLDKLYSH